MLILISVYFLYKESYLLSNIVPVGIKMSVVLPKHVKDETNPNKKEYCDLRNVATFSKMVSKYGIYFLVLLLSLKF